MTLVDLSYPISEDMETYPTDPDVCITTEKEIEKNRSLLHSFTMGTHTGTHLDAPAHILKNGKKLILQLMLFLIASTIQKIH